jgi:hypothetical protein
LMIIKLFEVCLCICSTRTQCPRFRSEIQTISQTTKYKKKSRTKDQQTRPICRRFDQT